MTGRFCVFQKERNQDDQKPSVAVRIGSGWDDEILQVTNSRHEKCQEGGKVLQYDILKLVQVAC